MSKTYPPPSASNDTAPSPAQLHQTDAQLVRSVTGYLQVQLHVQVPLSQEVRGTLQKLASLQSAPKGDGHSDVSA